MNLGTCTFIVHVHSIEHLSVFYLFRARSCLPGHCHSQVFYVPMCVDLNVLWFLFDFIDSNWPIPIRCVSQSNIPIRPALIWKMADFHIGKKKVCSTDTESRLQSYALTDIMHSQSELAQNRTVTITLRLFTSVPRTFDIYVAKKW